MPRDRLEQRQKESLLGTFGRFERFIDAALARTVIAGEQSALREQLENTVDSLSARGAEARDTRSAAATPSLSWPQKRLGDPE